MALDPNSYPSNSLNNPSIGPGQSPTSTASTIPTREKIKPVVSATVSQAKPGLGQRIKSVFFANDIPDLKQYIWRDVLVPSIRNMIVMGSISTIYALFFGKGANRNDQYPYGYGYPMNPYANLAARPTLGYPPTYTSYGTMNSGVKANGQPATGGTTVSPNPYVNMITPNMVRYTTRGEAEIVRDALAEVMRTFGRVTMADFFDLSGTQGNGPTDMNYGWTDLTGSHIENYTDGFGIVMPRAVPLA